MIIAEQLHKSFKRTGSGSGLLSLGKRFGSRKKPTTLNANRVVAVESVSFAAEDGRITGLLGPNGAGKSTTLRMLATLIKPDHGSARVDGFDVSTDVLKVRQHLGFMPHNAGIYPRLSARENIIYYARLCGLNKVQAEARVGQLIEQLDMHSFADRRANGFSQGQKTKVALARALAHRPQTLMLDEPTNGLDVMATRGLREIIRQLAADGHCVVFSSHIMQEVAALCDHIAIISDGSIAMQDTLSGILERTGEQDLEDAFIAATRILGDRSPT
ncbi:ATP-binding cassette domain-containing protein [Granulosicoccus antarcticus]|uniref:ABC transporter ATP-binding protein NatA n=1 Tax=Granulosicoccus antarcticus IMCC3135 TaxID=1192854 RepID=A0A2Z2NVY1_9GAMM|nr:ATP-binding cassette domain-containing protein [Granulosicoccus antarcticus]ASJ74685.1 ABC transporter ATP-binding protein NatA [Granulosicoccus antarcticus IMCC3135]